MPADQGRDGPNEHREPALPAEPQPMGQAGAFLAAIVASSEDAIIGLTLDGTILSWNAAAERLFGYSAAEAVGQHVGLIQPPERHYEQGEIMERLRHGKPLASHETVRLHRGGRRIDVSMTVSPVVDAEGRIIAASAISRDISPRKQAEREQAVLQTSERAARTALERARLRAETLAEASQDFAEAHLDLSAVLETVTQRLSEIIGDGAIIRLLDDEGRRFLPVAVYHPDPGARELARQVLASASRPANQGLHHQAVERRAAVLVPSVDMDAYRHTAGPDYAPYFDRFGLRSLILAPLRVGERALGTLILWRDRSTTPYTEDDRVFIQELADRASLAIENARHYREAQLAIKVRDEFLSIASHELRTPLTTVTGYIQFLERLLQQPELDRERFVRIVEQLRTQSDRFQDLVSDLLDATRIQQGRLEIRRVAVDLAELVQQVAQRFPQLSGEVEGHRFVLEQVGDVTGQWDPARLDQVFTNLLSNALKFSPDGGEIRVSLRRQGGMVTITVRDQGIGIASEEQSTLFEPFRRGSIGSHVTGTGLGLYITRNIVEQHFGRVQVASAPGQGATFTILLPIDGPKGE